jgi:homoserine O-succinyltransferase
MRERFDGLIVTGAPVETLPFEDVDYWSELTALLDYSRSNVFSTLHICWGAQAGLYRHYGVPKIALPKKLFGVFPHSVNEKNHELFRGFDDVFFAPQSRHTESEAQAIYKNPKLTVLSETPCAGPFLITARGVREIYITGHFEYDTYTLDGEYRRDAAKGLPIDIPQNYYRGNNPEHGPVVKWRSSANLFFRNWLNLVYQETPYDLADLSG